MFGFNPVVGTYSAGVRVGNWFEDTALQEVGNLVAVKQLHVSGCIVTKKKAVATCRHQ